MLPIEGRTQGQREADKAERIKQIMAKREFFESTRLGGTPAFCRTFIRDFRQQTGIEFVEPDAKADRYDAPVWQPYKTRCASLAAGVFDSYLCEPKIAETIERLPKDQRNAEYKRSCQHYRGTMNFKHFLVDINDNPKDGKEHVFYHEREEGPLNRSGAELNFGNGGYWIVDLDRCELKGGSRTTDPYSYDSYLRPLENYNGIIRYKGKHYIFDLYQGEDDLKNPSYGLGLDGHARFGEETRIGPLCLFSTIALKR